MKSALFYIAAAVAVIAAAVFVWAKFFSVKGGESQPAPTEGKGRGFGVDFMDPSKVDAGITPVKGNLELTKKPSSIANKWFGNVIQIKSSVPTGNPVRTQLKTIWK